MKKRYFALALFLLVFLLPFFFAPPLAATPNCNGVDTSIDFNCSKNSTDGVSAILMYVINFMAVGVGIAVVIGIIFGGITYASSDGEEAKAKEGREIIANSIIGLFLFIFLYAGANFLLPGGAFNLNAKPAVVTPPSTNTPDPDDKGKSPTLPTLKKIENFRDAGTATGAIKSGVLYRSGLLANASGDDKKKLSDLLKGGVIIDLRTSDSKKEEGADPTLEGVDHINIPIIGTTDYTRFVNGAEGKEASASFGKALKIIANSDGPVLVHCSYGKDRTGWLVAMAMYAVGASDSEVMTEYMKSKGQTSGKEDVRNGLLNGGLSAVREKYGTIKKYLTDGLGLSSSDIAALKTKLGA